MSRVVDLNMLAEQVEQFDAVINRHGKNDPGRDLEIEIALTQSQFVEGAPRYEGAGRNIVLIYEDGRQVSGGINGDINVPKYLGDTDDARRLQPYGWHVSMIKQDRWEPDYWYVGLRNAAIHESVSSRCNDLAKAWTAACLKALAIEAGR